MKKLAVFFIVLASLALMTGCNHSKQTVTRFSSDGESESTTTVTPLTNEEKPELTPIEIPETDNSDSLKTDEETEPQAIDTVSFSVISPAENVVSSDKGYHLIQGTTPESTEKIVINGFTLSKFKAGSTEWSYIAAASLGTLKKGENRYTVTAFNKAGSILGAKSFTITYKGIESGSLVSTGSSSLMLSLMIAFFASMSWFVLKRKNA